MKIELPESLENIVENLLFIISSSILSYIMEDIFTEALTIISGRYWSNVTMKCLFLVMIHVVGNSFRSYMRGFNCGLPRWCDLLKISSTTDASMSDGGHVLSPLPVLFHTFYNHTIVTGGDDETFLLSQTSVIVSMFTYWELWRVDWL